MESNLAGRLRAETQALHSQVERSAFMAALVGGRLGKQPYCLMLRNLQPLYVQLEAGLMQYANHASLASLFSPSLFRSTAIAADLDALYGPSWLDEIAVLPACTAYAERLQHLGETSPELLAAHAYVRYLGDLSGGQMLRSIVVRSLQLPPDQGSGSVAGTAFYDFGAPAEVARQSHAFRSGLDAVAIGDADAIVAEAKLAFEMHGSLFAELAVACDLLPVSVPAHQ